MKLIRTQNNVPDVYVNASRDFQLMCRLYDILINDVKYDTEAIKSIINTFMCNTRLLELLQTKLGFFTKSTISDEDLRYVLCAFPDIIKHKGSRQAIEEAVIVFLKLNHINSDFNIEFDKPNKYSVRVGIEGSVRDTHILDEIFRYILPAGYTFEYMFYVRPDIDEDIIDLNTSADVLYVGDQINSQIRHENYEDEVKDSMINAVDTVEIYNDDEEGIDTIIETVIGDDEPETEDEE